jgi:phenylacetate-CoA ligase
MISSEALARWFWLRGLGALGYDVGPRLDAYRGRQWLSREQLLADQSARLKAILRYAADQSPFYRRRIPPIRDHHSPADLLAEIEPLTKDDLRSDLQEILAGPFRRGGPEHRRLHRLSSGGSTGIPVRVVVDRPGYSSYYAPKLLGHEWFGLRVGAREARVFARPVRRLASVRQRVEDRVFNRILQSFYLSDAALLAFLRRMQRFRPEMLYGYTDSIYRLALTGKEHGLDGRAFDLRLVLCACETVYDFKRAELRQFFGCPVSSEYASAETGIIAFECPNGSLHVFTDNVFLEVLRDGEPAALGEPGEIFVTSLVNRAMPLIRYRLGDMVTLDDAPCRCGRQMPRIRSVEGRTTDFLVQSDGTPVHPMLLIHIMKAEGLGDTVKQFQVVQESSDRLILRLVKGSQFRPGVPDAICSQIRRHLGSAVRIEVEFVNRVEPEPSGKVRYFIRRVTSRPPLDALVASGS